MIGHINPGLSLYFHVPFCRHRCAYCDFNTYAGLEARIPEYVDALCREVEFSGKSLRAQEKASHDGGLGVVTTIFFGGGTPSLLTPEQFKQVFRTIHENFDLPDIAEVETSLEANPGTVSFASLNSLRQIGFNRISFGVQSTHLEELRQLERIHDYFQVIESVKWARQAGFDNLNLDLIFGLPEQPLERWQTTVRRVVGLEPEHLSLYALTVEQGTPFGRWAEHGLISLPDPDRAAEMYEWAEEYLVKYGYIQYEISNWCKPGRECRHNLQAWRNLTYLGFGAGAHGSAQGLRVANINGIKAYTRRMGTAASPFPFPCTPATLESHTISPRIAMQETMMLGLRLVEEGVSDVAFKERFGMGIAEAFPKDVNKLLRMDLVEWIETPRLRGEVPEVRLRLASHARLVGNQVFMRFVD